MPAEWINRPYPVEVVWEDAFNIGPWMERDDIEQEFLQNRRWLVTSVGMLIYQDDNCVLVAGRRSADLRAFGLIERIPRGMVVSVRKIRQR